MPYMENAPGWAVLLCSSPVQGLTAISRFVHVRMTMQALTSISTFTLTNNNITAPGKLVLNTALPVRKP